MRLYPTLLMLAVAPILLTGCSAATSIASNTYPDVPNGSAEDVNLFSAQPFAVWVHGKTILAVVTVGSGSCPPVPTSISTIDSTTIALTFVKSANNPCSSDLGPTTHEFKIPDGVEVDKPVTVKVHFDFETDIDYTVAVQN